MSNFKTKESLEKAMNKKWDALLADCPEYNTKWIDGKNKLLDWYDRELKKINKKQYERKPDKLTNTATIQFMEWIQYEVGKLKCKERTTVQRVPF